MSDEPILNTVMLCVVPVAAAAPVVAAVPIPRIAVTTRPATMADLPFIDALQKLHTKQVGWMPTKQLEGKIGAGHVLVAEEIRDQKSGISKHAATSSLTSDLRPLTSVPVGYCIGHDQYFKRDDVGIIYQMNVVPGRQRGLIGATLLKAMFDRAAYGCRLFCCWCAQDIEANRFWESMGFIPLAFRSGSASKARTHIFWQRRIRSGDTTTPYWFPAQTSSGSIREDRIVLPIPPGTHWSDAKPMILPGAASAPEPRRLPDAGNAKGPKPSKAVPVQNPSAIAAGGLRFAAPVPPQSDAITPKRAAKTETKTETTTAVKTEAKTETKKKAKNDPRLIAAARELRDRWLEQVNAEGFGADARGKYEVSRAIAGPVGTTGALPPAALKSLPQAA